MVADDRDAYPMNCGAEFVFQGRMQREACEVALEKTVARHPMLRVTLSKNPKGRLSWIESDEQPKSQWLSTDSPNMDFANPRRVRWGKESPLRIWVQIGEDQTNLQVEWHHACCDAAGGMLIVEDFFVFYANELCESEPMEPRPLDASAIVKRGGMRAATRLGIGNRAVALWKDICKSYTLTMNPPVTLASLRDNSSPIPTGSNQMRYVARHFEHEHLRALRCAATDQGATFNDFVIKNLFVVMKKWNERHTQVDPDQHFRVVMPMSLRTEADREMSAANCLSYAFLTRSSQEIETNQLLAGIRDETQAMRKYQLPLGMLKKLRFLTRMGISMKRYFKDDACCGTAILTNLGDPTRRFHNRFPRERGLIRVGNLVLENIVGIAPLRPLTHAVFDVFTYGNRLSLALRCDPHFYTEEDSYALVDLFAEELERAAGLEPERSPQTSAPPAAIEVGRHA